MPTKIFRRTLALLAVSVLSWSPQAIAAPQILLPRTGITVDELALLINDDDPLSRQTGAYYQLARGIPDRNVIHLHLPIGKSAISPQEFEPLKAEVDRLTPKQIDDMVADGTLSGGMLPKIGSALDAARNGVKGVHIIDGRVEHALLLEILTDHGVGTMIKSH